MKPSDLYSTKCTICVYRHFYYTKNNDFLNNFLGILPKDNTVIVLNTWDQENCIKAISKFGICYLDSEFLE
jgi:hypothetical protein